jgi:hypothetical protein
MPVEVSPAVISHAIQLAIAPVFLLTGIGGLFVGAMVAVICGLVCFLREVYLATHTISIDHTHFE